MCSCTIHTFISVSKSPLFSLFCHSHLHPRAIRLNHISSIMGSRKRKSNLCRALPAVLLVSAIIYIGSAYFVANSKQKLSRWNILAFAWKTRSRMCEDISQPCGTEALPKGIIASKSDLEMRPLWGSIPKKKSSREINLLAMAVGIKQKENVDKIVKKFLSGNFVVMLFHYDGNVNGWKDLEWNSLAIHVSAINQTKWWFAKRFIHPDIVYEYSFIFLWDEDLGVQNFDVGRYLSIIKREGLEISQPALDPETSEVHHPLTARKKGSVVHRSINQLLRGGKRCDENSTGPPCTGWVEMMAPVFSRTSWRCTWNMIQNDLVHAWGVDFQLGYCAQGDRTKKIGIVDSEYVVHYGLPTLGGSSQNKRSPEASGGAVPNIASTNLRQGGKSTVHESRDRDAVRKQSYTDLERFKSRWRKAVNDDKSWIDQYGSN